MDNSDSQLELKWTLTNPFVPPKHREVIFDETKWKATIDSEISRSVFRGGGACPFTFGFQYIGARHPFVLQHLFIKIAVLNEVEWAVHDGVYTFDEENGYSLTSVRYTRYWECRLDITVRMTVNHDYEYHAGPLTLIPPVGAGRGIMNTLGLAQLSEDLGRLLNDDNPYFNMSLRSAYGSRRNVHSFMIRARWSNFFRRHDENEIVSIALSDDLLSDLVFYLYTGCGRLVDGTKVNHLEYMTEALQVMRSYDIRHLSRIFEANYSSHQQSIEVRVHTTNHVIKLPPGSASYLCYPSAVEGVYISFCIVLYLDRDPPSFDYKLVFWCEKTCYVRVDLDFVVKYPQNRVAFWPVFGKDYEPDLRDSEERETESFNGDFPGFQDYLRRPEVEDLERYFRITCYVSDGEEAEIHTKTKTKNTKYRKGNRDEDSRIELSRNMYECLRRMPPEPTELRVHARAGPCLSLHRAMITTRIEEWRTVFNVPAENPIPLDLRCNLSNDELRHVIDFIYTGVMFGSVPDDSFPPMEDFAERGGVPSLQNFLFYAAAAIRLERNLPSFDDPRFRELLLLFPS